MKKIILFLVGTALIAASLAFLFGSDGLQTITGYLLLEQPKDAVEKSSPFDRIKEEQISVYDSLIIMHINNSEIASLGNTNSMDPLIDQGSSVIQIKPKDAEDIHVGDILSYRDISTKKIILHRVVAIGNDNSGKYFVLKGDNIDSADPVKVRFGQIKGIVVAIVY